jgi:hypothetical protein
MTAAVVYPEARCRASSAVEQRFCKAKVIGSNPLSGLSWEIPRVLGLYGLICCSCYLAWVCISWKQYALLAATGLCSVALDCESG